MRAARLSADRARRAFIDAHRGEAMGQPGQPAVAGRARGGEGCHSADGAAKLLGPLELAEAVARLGEAKYGDDVPGMRLVESTAGALGNPNPNRAGQPQP